MASVKRGCSCQIKLCSGLLELITIKMLGKHKNYEVLAYVIVSVLLLFHLLSLVQILPQHFVLGDFLYVLLVYHEKLALCSDKTTS